MKKTKTMIALGVVVLAPVSAFAADLGNIENLLRAFGKLIGLATPIVLGIALLAFFWGLAKFIFNAGNDEKKKEGTSIMIWGAVAFFVMVTITGIVQFIGDAVGISDEGDFKVPGVEGV